MITRRIFTAFAATPAFAATGKIRTAVIGTGHGHALSKIRALRAMPEYEFAGVCQTVSTEPTKDNALVGVNWLSFDQILNDASIEMVAVESAEIANNLNHAERLVKAGKFVHLDKPPGADLIRLRKLFDDAAARGRIVQMGYQWRYHPAMQAVVQAAQNGWLGRVYRFRASIDKLIDEKERRYLAKFKGGMMFSEGCHLVDRAVAVLGRPVKVTGFLRHESPIEDGLKDNTLAVLEYEHAIAEITLSGFHPHGGVHRYLEIFGTNGSARMQPYTFPSKFSIDLAKPAGPYKAGEQTIEMPAPPGPPYGPDFLELAAVIRQGAKPSHSTAHDLLTQETLLRVCDMLGAA